MSNADKPVSNHNTNIIGIRKADSSFVVDQRLMRFGVQSDMCNSNTSNMNPQDKSTTDCIVPAKRVTTMKHKNSVDLEHCSENH